jgi:hypothetical protein
LKKAKFPVDYDEYLSEDEINLGLLQEGTKVVEIEKVSDFMRRFYMSLVNLETLGLDELRAFARNVVSYCISFR